MHPDWEVVKETREEYTIQISDCNVLHHHGFCIFLSAKRKYRFQSRYSQTLPLHLHTCSSSVTNISSKLQHSNGH